MPIFIIGFFFFVLGLSRQKKAIKLLIFFIPFEVASLFGFGLPGVMVLGFYLGQKVSDWTYKRKINSKLYLKKYIFLIWVAVFMSILALIFNTDINDLYFEFDSSINKPLYKYMFNFFAGIAFYSILIRSIHTYQDMLDSIFTFILSTSYVFITWIGSFQYDWHLPLFLQTVHSGGTFERFAGYTGEYGLMSEYFFIVLVLSSFLVMTKNKTTHVYWGTIIFIASIPMALSTGTRAFVFVLFIFFIILFSLFFRKGKIRFRHFVLSVVLIVSIAVVVISMFAKSLLFERLQESVEISGKVTYLNEIDMLLNRGYFSEFDNVIDVGGLFGVGPLNILGVRGNVMAWHSLYYDFIIKFGIFGFFVYLLFFTKLIRTLYARILKEQNNEMYHLGITLLAMLVALLLGEYARSYQNQTSFMLMYWFMFSLIAIYVNLPKEEKIKFRL